MAGEQRRATAGQRARADQPIINLPDVYWVTVYAHDARQGWSTQPAQRIDMRCVGTSNGRYYWHLDMAEAIPPVKHIPQVRQDDVAKWQRNLAALLAEGLNVQVYPKRVNRITVDLLILE